MVEMQTCAICGDGFFSITPKPLCDNCESVTSLLAREETTAEIAVIARAKYERLKISGSGTTWYEVKTIRKRRYLYLRWMENGVNRSKYIGKCQ